MRIDDKPTPRMGVITETKNIEGNTVIESRHASGFWMPKKIRTKDPNGNVYIEHFYENGLNVKRQKINGKFKVIYIKHKSISQSLYEDAPANPIRKSSNGMFISAETLKIFEKLPTELKRVCEPSVKYLIERAQKALKTDKSWFERLKSFLKLKQTQLFLFSKMFF